MDIQAVTVSFASNTVDLPGFSVVMIADLWAEAIFT
jgi:hypothetical protein